MAETMTVKEMFWIHLDLEEIEVEGLEALDLRRKLGLPDGSWLRTQDTRTVKAPVQEDWARAYFGPQQRAVSRMVRVGMLAPGDLDAESEDSPIARLTLDLHPDRICDLWLSARDYDLAHPAPTEEPESDDD